jgi:hypothetical protein
MSFVKTFEQFKSLPLTEAAEPKQIQAKTGELARWNVVLRSRDEETISDKNPSQTIVRELSEYGGFKRWWLSKIDGIPVQKSLAVIYTGVSGKKNLLGKEVAKAEIAFFPYLEQARGVMASDNGAAAVVKYDVSKAEPIATSPVEGSSVDLMVWHEEDLKKIKIDFQPGFIQAKGKDSRLIPFDLVNPPYMYKNGLGADAEPTKGGSPTATNTATNTTTTQTQTSTQTSTQAPASAEMIAVTDKFVGLKMNNAKVQLAQDLQEIIMKNGTGSRPTDAALLKDYDTRVSAATRVRTDGGADGRYGNATGTAIGILIGTGQVVPEVTKEVADKLAASFTGISPTDAAALIGAAGSTQGTQRRVTTQPKKKLW